MAFLRHINPFDADINPSTVLLTGFMKPVLARSNRRPI
jgi:hypothetical protein